MTIRSEELAGQVALVTGASRGIGAAVAEAIAARGAHVVITARTAGGLEELEDRIHNSGGSATIAPLDLTDGDSIARLASAMAERWQKLDMLVLNAAMLGTLTPVAAIDGKEFNRLLTLNLIAQQALIANFDPLLRRAANGRLLALTDSEMLVESPAAAGPCDHRAAHRHSRPRGHPYPDARARLSRRKSAKYQGSRSGRRFRRKVDGRGLRQHRLPRPPQGDGSRLTRSLQLCAKRGHNPAFAKALE
jgi:NAD(P)-dependent dehydrogenase (short-subunit alcohol dehydrogenase family)